MMIELRSFGEILFFTVKNKFQRNLRNQGTVCMVVAYPQNHSDYVYHLFIVKIRQAINSRDLICLDKLGKVRVQRSKMILLQQSNKSFSKQEGLQSNEAI
jgi:hypothetical protein